MKSHLLTKIFWGSIFLSGALLIAVGLYLSTVPAEPESVVIESKAAETTMAATTLLDAIDSQPQGDEITTAVVVLPESGIPDEAWCDAMLLKPNAKWNETDISLFSTHCLSPGE